ncbi:MAG: histidine kinase [Bacteroidota bacterium]
MRCTLILFMLCLIHTCCLAQKLEMNLDSIHPVIKHDSHGDSIRKYFSNTFHSQEATFFKQGNLLISAFFSNKLAVNYDHALAKIPQLKNYSNPDLKVFARAWNSYAGAYAVPIFDSTGIVVTVNGINPQNANEYEFRVLEDGKKIILPWTKAKIFTKVYWMSKIADSNKIDDVTAYLGQFKAGYGKALTFQVRDKNIPDKINTSLTAYWVKWKPRVVGVFTFSQLPEFLGIFKEQWSADPGGTDERPDWSKDSTFLKLKKKFSYNENNLIFYLDDIISSKKIIEYSLVKGSDSSGWTVNDFDFNLVWLKNLTPGSYKLKIRYSVQRQNVCSYSFTIQAAWYQTLWAKIGLTFLGLLAVGFVFLLWRSRMQAEKLKAQDTLKRLVQTELKSIRSQFNPHFVFNALSSIQGLITRNDPQNASKYLIEFSNLMRDSLKASNNEFVSISTEIKILENYLNLEKLRFGFNYQIIASANIDANAVEIPSLFLQPLVENAVKHGISALQEKGQLVVSFEKSHNDMLVLVKDNGMGFNENEATNGFGLQLTKERIKLLNQTLNEQDISMAVSRNDNQTQITIQFKNWFI